MSETGESSFAAAPPAKVPRGKTPAVAPPAATPPPVVRIDDLLEEEVDVVLTLGKQDVNVRWCPQGFTVEVLQRGETSPDGVVEALVTTVRAWNLVDREGQPVKIDRESLQKQSYYTLSRILNGLLEQLSPNPSASASFSSG